jgi:hypothetical protein
VGNFRLHALNVPVTVNSFLLTTGGTGDWNADVDATSGVQIYRDDGDGVFSTTDTLIFQGGGGATVPCAFTPGVGLITGQTADLWILVMLTANAGAGQTTSPETFTFAIASGANVNATVPAMLGLPAPASVSLGAIEFNVTSFKPIGDHPKGGRAITVTGVGFMTPFSVTIDGQVCPGSPFINNGTVTGLSVPAGTGESLPIVIHSGTLTPQTLPQTFSYGVTASSGPSSGDGGCVGAPGTLPAAAAMLALMAAGAIARRRKQRSSY